METRCTPPDLREIAKSAAGETLSATSADRYNKVYDSFVDWCKEKTVPDGYNLQITNLPVVPTVFNFQNQGNVSFSGCSFIMPPNK